MQVVIAIDSFKGSLSSLQAGNAVKEAVLQLNKDAQVQVCPMADGGEGTAAALCDALGGTPVDITVTGPGTTPVQARYYILRDGMTAVLEMAAAAGLTLVPVMERNPLETTTYGVGEMIKDAISRGCRRFIVGIGGSATNDGGLGMLSALGYTFSDKEGNSVSIAGKGLQDLHRISDDNVLPELKECEFCIACDVNNPLCGSNGCSAVYGPQKGATPQIVSQMDAWLAKYAALCAEISPKADMHYPGVGAAGGLGFAFYAFTNAVLKPGIDIVLDEIKLESYIKNADIVVTGEGRLDSQTVMGKAPAGVAKLAKKHGKKVIAFSGCVADDAEICNAHGIDAFFPIVRGITTLEEALDTKNAYRNLMKTATQVFRLLDI